MKTLFLHIGHGKTGSSFLQTGFHFNAQKLSEGEHLKWDFRDSIPFPQTLNFSQEQIQIITKTISHEIEILLETQLPYLSDFTIAKFLRKKIQQVIQNTTRHIADKF